MVSSSLYFYLRKFDLQRPMSVLSLFRHFQCNHGASDLGPRSSDGISVVHTAGGGSMLSVVLLKGFYQVV